MEYAINSKNYFWKKKTAKDIAADISNTLKNLILARQNQQLFIVGYSFGADAVPFIINRIDRSYSTGRTKKKEAWVQKSSTKVKRSLTAASTRFT